MTTTVNIYSKGHPVFSVEAYGAKGDNDNDDLVAIDAAIAAAKVSTSGGTQGATVSFGQGTFMVSGPVVVPNRITLQGSSARGTEIKATSGFTGGSYVVQFINGTSAMFDTGLINIGVSANSVSSTGCVQHNAFQENSIINRVLLRGFTTTGLDIVNGYGGAAWGLIENIEIGGGASATGLSVDVAGMILNINGFTIHASDGGDTLLRGIDIGDVFGVVCNTAGHFERCVDGFYLNDGNSRLVINGVVSGDANTTNVIRTLSNNQTVVVNGLVYANGSTRTIYNGTIGETGRLRNYIWPAQLPFTDDATPDLSSGGGCPRNVILNGTTTLTGFDGVQDGWFWMTEFNGVMAVTDSASMIVQGGSIANTADGDGMFCYHSNGVTFCLPVII